MHLPSRSRLVLFAFGDFAFNLYWQSIMLFLLFYYTDALELPIGVAATTYMVASIWDGIANFAAGALVDRGHDRIRYGALIAAGAAPLGLMFVLTYLPPAASGALGDRLGPRRPSPFPHRLCGRERPLSGNVGAHQPGSGRPRLRRRAADAVRDGGRGDGRAFDRAAWPLADRRRRARSLFRRGDPVRAHSAR